MKNLAIYLIPISLLTISCEPIVETLDLPEQELQLVMNATLDASINPFTGQQEPVVVQLSKSKLILDDQPLELITDGKVELYEGGSLVATLTHESNGNYIDSNYILKQGKSYSVKASVPGLPPTEGKDVVPVAVPIKQMDTTVTKSSGGLLGGGEATFGLDITIDDPAGVKNFYLVQIFGLRWEYLDYDSIGNPVDSTLSIDQIYFEVDNPILNSSSYITDELFDGQTFTFPLNMFLGYFTSVDGGEEEYVNDYLQLFVSLSSTTEGGYKYFSSRQLNAFSEGDPFSQPVRVFSNTTAEMGVVYGVNSEVRTIDL